jgi:hypothetical protein
MQEIPSAIKIIATTARVRKWNLAKLASGML